jgi:hypothetical protein
MRRKRLRRSSTDARFYKWIKFPYVGYWHVEPAQGVDPIRLQFSLLTGEPLDDPPAILDFAVITPGKPMDFATTALGLPVASPRASTVLLRVAPGDVQLIPCRIDNEYGGFNVVNIVTRLDCADRPRSKVIVPGDPDGGLGDMVAWIVDPGRVGEHTLFRLDNEHLTIVLAETLKQEIEREHLVGPGMVEMDGEERRYIKPGFMADP